MPLILVIVGAWLLYDSFNANRASERFSAVIESGYYRAIVVLIVILFIHNNADNANLRKMLVALSVLIGFGTVVNRGNKNG